MFNSDIFPSDINRAFEQYAWRHLPNSRNDMVLQRSAVLQGYVYIPSLPPMNVLTNISSADNKRILQMIDDVQPNILAKLVKYYINDVARLIYNAYFENLKSFILSKSRQHPPEEIASETISTLFIKSRSNSSWRGPAPTLWQWLSIVAYNLTRNTTYNRHRSYTVLSELTVPDNSESDAPSAYETMDMQPAFTQRVDDFEQIDLRTEIELIMTRASQELTNFMPQQQIETLLTLLGEKSLSEIARILDVPKASVEKAVEKIRAIAIEVMNES